MIAGVPTILFSALEYTPTTGYTNDLTSLVIEGDSGRYEMAGVITRSTQSVPGYGDKSSCSYSHPLNVDSGFEDGDQNDSLVAFILRSPCVFATLNSRYAVRQFPFAAAIIRARTLRSYSCREATDCSALALVFICCGCYWTTQASLPLQERLERLVRS